MRILKTIGMWLLQVLVAMLFVALGIGKFQDRSWERNFARWGYPAGFHRVAGVMEAAGGAGMLVPGLTTYATAMLGGVMAAAAITHAVHGESQRVMVPLVYLLILALVGWLRRRSAWRPHSRPPAQRAAVTG